jgi:hypothetical protein
MSFESNDSLIMGEPCNANFGRHGRWKMVFVDEGAWLGGTGESLKAAHTAIGDTTKWFTCCSTPNGMNYYGQLRHGLLTDEEFVPHITTLWWWRHPLKGKEWYEHERRRRTVQSFAQEVDIDYKASVVGIVYHEFSYATHMDEGDLFSPHLELRTALDPGRSDASAWGLFQPDRANDQHNCILYIERTQKVVDWFVPFYLGYVPDVDHAGSPWPHVYSARELEAIDLVAAWYAAAGRPVYNYGDEAGFQKTANYYLSAYQVLQQYGVPMYGVRHEDKRNAVEHSILLLRATRFSKRALMERFGDRHAKTLGECLTNYRWKEEDDAGLLQPHRVPLHGVYSHGTDMLQIYHSQQPVPRGVSQLTPDGKPASSFNRRVRDRLRAPRKPRPANRRYTKY